MKKKKLTKIIIPLTVLITILVLSKNVYAQDWYDVIQGLELKNAINLIINTILGLVGTVALLFLIIGGYQYITSAGNPDQLQKAKTTLLYSIIGLAIAILAFIIINAVLSSLGVK